MTDMSMLTMMANSTNNPHTRRLTMNRLLLILALTLTPGCASVNATIQAARLVTNGVLDDAAAAVRGISAQDQEDRP